MRMDAVFPDDADGVGAGRSLFEVVEAVVGLVAVAFIVGATARPGEVIRGEAEVEAVLC